MNTRSKTRAAKDPPPTSAATKSSVKTARKVAGTTKTTTTVQTTRKKKSNNANANAISSSKRAGGDPPTDRNPPADDPSLAFTLADLNVLNVEDQKRKVQAIFTFLGHENIHVQLTKGQVEVVLSYFEGLEANHFKKLMKRFVPGYDERSIKLSTLVSHLLKALFPAESLDGVPKHGGVTYCDVSLRATYARICGVNSQPSNKWTQKILIRGIELQEEFNFHRTDLTNEQLKSFLINECSYPSHEIDNMKTRLALLRKLWMAEGKLDYTPVRHRATAVGGAAPSGSTASAGDGAGVPSMAGVGAPPTPNVAPPVQAPTAGAPAPAAGANEDELEQLQLKVARLEVEGQKNTNNLNQRMNGLDIDLREQQFQLGDLRGQLNELTVQQMSSSKPR